MQADWDGGQAPTALEIRPVSEIIKRSPKHLEGVHGCSQKPEAAARWQTLIFKSWSCWGLVPGAVCGQGWGWEAGPSPAHTQGAAGIPSRHPAQSFPWELLHSKEPRDALPDVCPSKAGNQGSPTVFCCVETPGDALSKATGDRGPSGHSVRLGALQDRSHQQLDTLQRPTVPSPPALAFLPLLAPGWRWVFWRTEVFFKAQDIV